MNFSNLHQLKKNELLEICATLNIQKCKSKNKTELISLITAKQTHDISTSTVNMAPITNIEVEIPSLETETSGLKFIDLFCGIGGFHQAMKMIGGTCVLACDIDKDCRRVYFDNYGLEPLSNVKDINEKTMPNFDILCAGFPCQAFSNGGKKKCFGDDRGLLFDEIVRIAREKQPKFMFLENVKHILKVSNGEVIQYIKKKIDDIGYILQLFEISPHNFGIPQQRERVYFVCIRKDIYNGIPITLPTYTGTLDFTRFLDNPEEINDKYFIKGDVLNVLNAWDKMVKQFQVGEKISPTIMINDAFVNYSETEFNSFPDWKREYITKNKPLLEKYNDEFLTWYVEHSELLKKREIYGKLEWQTGPIKQNDSIFNHFIQIRQSGIRVKKCQYFPTLVAICQIPIYGKEKRYITPRECARLQSFPESFRLSEDDKKSYKQLGNSVNVDNVYTVISSTLKQYININNTINT
jgi:DNA (cytosine-5)-methyltransferase 1